MKRFLGLLGIAVVLCALPKMAIAQGAEHLLAANHTSFELASAFAPEAGGAGGTTVYTHVVTVPSGDNVLLITMSGTGDAEAGTLMYIGCQVGSNPCFAPGGDFNGTPSGWVLIFQGTGVTGAEGRIFSYTFCKTTSAGNRTVKLKLASNPTGNGVNAEDLSYQIRSANISASNDRCATDTSAPLQAPFK